MSSLSKTRLKFANPIGGLALIEGAIKLTENSLLLDMAMTESVTGAVDGVLNYEILLSAIESVEYKKKWFGKSIIEFTSHDIGTFKRIPGSKGFNYTITPVARRAEVKSFVYDLLYRLTEVEAKRIEDSYNKVEE